jgi:hypothetical protein
MQTANLHPAEIQFSQNGNQFSQNLVQSEIQNPAELQSQPESEMANNPILANQAANEGSSDMLIGALWCIGGIVFTAVTYNAVKETGGTYFVAWGAIVYGGWQFLKGLFSSI